jgi:hypothetical protein
MKARWVDTDRRAGVRSRSLDCVGLCRQRRCAVPLGDAQQGKEGDDEHSVDGEQLGTYRQRHPLDLHRRRR